MLVVSILLALLPFLLCHAALASQVRRREREWRRAWREQLAGPSEDLRALILDCDIFTMKLAQGELRHDPEVARFLSRMRNREYVALARELSEPASLEGFLAHAEFRMGRRDRPMAMDYGYLQEVLDELARRARATGGPPYR